jgi:hypothetical protein
MRSLAGSGTLVLIDLGTATGGTAASESTLVEYLEEFYLLGRP